MLTTMNATPTLNWAAHRPGFPIHNITGPFPSLHPTVNNLDDEEYTTDFETSDSDEESSVDSDLGTAPDDVVTTDTPHVKPGDPVVPASDYRQDKPGAAPEETATPRNAPWLKKLVRKYVKEELHTIDASGKGITKPDDETVRRASSPPGPPDSSRLSPQPHPGYVGSVPPPAAKASQEYLSQTSNMNIPPHPVGVRWCHTMPLVSPSDKFSGLHSGARPSAGVSAVDSKWGVLFDERGPTKRWDQVIKGLGQYVMDEFLPKNTLLVTPEKLKVFYSSYKLNPEEFPLIDVFKNGSANMADKLANLYQQLNCEYYLVPSKPRDRPTEPGLTLDGWSKWMTIFLQSYPSEEAKRFEKVVVDLPINAESLLDGKLERLPRQISRHLLPGKVDVSSRMKFDQAMRTAVEAMQLVPLSGRVAPPSPTERRPSQSRPVSPRSRYRPPSVDDPSPSSSVVGSPPDDDKRRGDRDRDRINRDSSNRTYESNGSARRDPPRAPTRSATGPAASSSTRPPLSNPRRRSTPPPRHQHSVSEVSGGGERGHATTFSRSASDVNIYSRRTEMRERDRERERERERDRDRDQRDRDRDRERDSKSRGRDRDGDRRDSRRSASVASPEKRGGRPSRRNSVIVKDERDNAGRRSPTYDSYLYGKQAGSPSLY
ncbi:hypothetical protein QBC35DRAFT_491112 [Podospora australis]|uniref:DUF7514 domain-containing protein n=1 Tax=Podospora australis TaxID=1536484 RepID=A0AAN7AKN8_9PEZI|nr:hypothetical protein QBC35DRAFT_491112 [Podospora australis]